MSDSLPKIASCFYCQRNAEVEPIEGSTYYRVRCVKESCMTFRTPEQAIEAHKFIAQAIDEKILKRMDRGNLFKGRYND